MSSTAQLLEVEGVSPPGPPTGKSISVSVRVVRAVRAGEAKLRGRIGGGRRNAGASDGSVSSSFSSGGCFPVTMFRGF